MILTASQIRAGRALLDWSQEELAKQADVTLRTIANVEGGAPGSATTLTGILRAMEEAGLEFLPGNGLRERDATAVTYKGEDAIISVLDDVYETVAVSDDREILIANNSEPTEYSERVAAYLHDHLARLKSVGAHEKIMSCEGDANLVSDIADYRCVAADDFTDAPTLIYANKIALMKWGPPAKAVIISDALLAKSMRKLFGHAWKHARTPEGTL